VSSWIIRSNNVVIFIGQGRPLGDGDVAKSIVVSCVEFLHCFQTSQLRRDVATLPRAVTATTRDADLFQGVVEMGDILGSHFLG
jgi:hypothetical protein